MLFDDDDQLEVRHVVSLAHHDVSIHSGGDVIPEGELFIKRNAICLSRKASAGEVNVDGTASKPFFLFSENCSDKEDFYFALLRNQERKEHAEDNPPRPLQYDVKDMIHLVQKLHSSEEHLQTRWINAIMGRLFLALYKTTEVENNIRAKITKKIARVKTPSFLSGIVLQAVDMGSGAPYITNPKLKDLTVDGECVIEADIKYSGNFRLEVAATARIELGSRFKAREVNLVLAVVLKKIEGHMMVRIKPPPSNRIWITFSAMPKIEMSIEPIVSSRQITYNIILRQIENRIKEVIAETVVFPNWDDSPFQHTTDHKWRGGIWANDKPVHAAPNLQEAAAEEGEVDEVERMERMEDQVEKDAINEALTLDSSNSMSSLANDPPSLHQRKPVKSPSNLEGIKASESASTSKVGGLLSNLKIGGSSTSIDTQSSTPTKPKALRSGSFASVSSPVVSTDITNVDAIKNGRSAERSEAVSSMAAISVRSQTTSPVQTPVGSPSRGEKFGSYSSISSRDSRQSEKEGPDEQAPSHTPMTQPDIPNVTSSSSSFPPTPSSISAASSLKSFGQDSRRENSSSSSGKSTHSGEKRLSLAAVTNAAASAKKWGWNALQRHAESKEDHADVPDSQRQQQPIGRGFPLPPPGTPLPPPARKTKTAPIPVPKRKPMPLPSLPQRQKGAEAEDEGESRKRPAPPLPRRRGQRQAGEGGGGDGMLVVEAPQQDSEPTTPLDERPNYLQPWVADAEEDEDIRPPRSPDGDIRSNTLPADALPAHIGRIPPDLPRRRPLTRVMSGSPEEDVGNLPSWVAAQEQEARAKSIWVDEEGGS